MVDAIEDLYSIEECPIGLHFIEECPVGLHSIEECPIGLLCWTVQAECVWDVHLRRL